MKGGGGRCLCESVEAGHSNHGEQGEVARRLRGEGGECEDGFAGEVWVDC